MVDKCELAASFAEEKPLSKPSVKSFLWRSRPTPQSELPKAFAIILPWNPSKLGLVYRLDRSKAGHAEAPIKITTDAALTPASELDKVKPSPFTRNTGVVKVLEPHVTFIILSCRATWACAYILEERNPKCKVRLDAKLPSGLKLISTITRHAVSSVTQFRGIACSIY